MSRPVNELQLKVLQWIAEGCPDDSLPTEGNSYKTSALALKDRGLVTVTRRAGGWQAHITDAGLHYLAHGEYPVSPEAPNSRVPRTPRQRSTSARTTRTPLKPPKERPSRNPTPTAPGIAILTQIRNPHRAMKELLDHPKRIDLPSEMRRRAQLISHTLAQEALGRGWKVSAVVGEMRTSAHSRPQRRWPSSDLFTIDAGACELGVQIRDKPKRIPHVDSPDEARRRARGEWVYAHKYDFIPTGLLQLRLYRGTSEESSWVDNERAPLEDRMEAVVNRIQKATDRVLEIRKQQRLRQEEERRRQEEFQRQRLRAAKYDSWIGALELMQQRHQQHAALTEFLAALASRAEGISDSDTRQHFYIFIGWARGHLEATDPLRNPPIPLEDPPDMDYAEWTRWKERFERRAW